MHQKIPGTSGFYHFFGRLTRQIFVLFKKIKHFVEASGHSHAFVTHDMCGNINTALNCQLEIEGNNILKITDLKKTLRVRAISLSRLVLPRACEPER
jgi:hypothetical protein